MLRTTATGALLCALLVLASGSAFGSAAASTGPAADAVSSAELPAQENATTGNATQDNATTENATQDGTTAENVTQDDATENATANVTFTNRSSNGSAVTVERAVLPEGGYVVIHVANRTSPGNVTVGPVVGNSSYLEAGTVENLTVALDRSLDESQWLVAMPHRDTGEERVYEFPLADDPYFVEASIPVTDDAYVEVTPGADANATDEMPAENVTADDETEATDDETTDGADDETMANETAGEANGNETKAHDAEGNETKAHDAEGNETKAGEKGCDA